MAERPLNAFELGEASTMLFSMSPLEVALEESLTLAIRAASRGHKAVEATISAVTPVDMGVEKRRSTRTKRMER
jgi:hypothetical protein